jgi:hypothetical protein
MLRCHVRRGKGIGNGGGWGVCGRGWCYSEYSAICYSMVLYAIWLTLTYMARGSISSIYCFEREARGGESSSCFCFVFFVVVGVHA